MIEACRGVGFCRLKPSGREIWLFVISRWPVLDEFYVHLSIFQWPAFSILIL